MILENDASFKSAAREQDSLLTPLEKKALLWLAHRMPVWVSPDHLTVLGLLGTTLAGVCYYAARWCPLAVLGSILFLFINWFGDSLDGTLARVRQRQRPRYGHVTEARHGPYNVIRSGQETVNEVEPLFVCHGLPHSLGLRIEDTHGRSAHDGARGIVSHAADSAPIRLCLEKTGRLEKTCQDKQSRENLFD